MIEVVRVVGLCTVQDRGRRGHMHEAVPPGGALVPELLVAANRQVRNPDDAPAIEVLGRLVVRATTEAFVATDREAKTLRAGEELVVESAPLRATYLAIRGGVTAPELLGGRGVLLCAGLGKPLARGDRVECAQLLESHESPHRFRSYEPHETVGVVAGPDLDAFAGDVLDHLQAATYRISATSDRVGTRLEGPALVRATTYRDRSRPMVSGALEVPRDGQPIVLGPEHPTTGGYPIVAVIASAELDRFFAIPLGGSVRFRV